MALGGLWTQGEAYIHYPNGYHSLSWVYTRRNENVAKNEDAHRGSHIKNETAAENRGYREPTRDLVRKCQRQILDMNTD